MGDNGLQLVACEGRSEVHRFEPARLQEGATFEPKRGVNPGEVMDRSTHLRFIVTSTIDVGD